MAKYKVMQNIAYSANGVEISHRKGEKLEDKDIPNKARYVYNIFIKKGYINEINKENERRNADFVSQHIENLSAEITGKDSGYDSNTPKGNVGDDTLEDGVRIHEIAKELDISSKELIAFLDEKYDPNPWNHFANKLAREQALAIIDMYQADKEDKIDEDSKDEQKDIVDDLAEGESKFEDAE